MAKVIEEKSTLVEKFSCGHTFYEYTTLVPEDLKALWKKGGNCPICRHEVALQSVEQARIPHELVELANKLTTIVREKLGTPAMHLQSTFVETISEDMLQFIYSTIVPNIEAAVTLKLTQAMMQQMEDEKGNGENVVEEIPTCSCSGEECNGDCHHQHQQTDLKN